MATDNKNKVLNVPNKGNVPRLRFPEFTEDYEKHNLGELGETLIGLTYSPTDVVREGGIIVLRSSNIKNGVTNYDDIVRVNKKIKGSIITRPNDILVCARNGSPRLIGKNAILKEADSNITFGAFMMIYRSIDNMYIHQLLYTKRFYSQVGENLGARINQITTSDFNSFEFYFPKTKEERIKIASLLSLIDKRIETQNKIIEDLKKLKVAIRDRELNSIRKHYGLNMQISKMLDYEQPSKYIVSETEYLNNKEFTPVLTANKAFILGYTDEPFNIYDKGECIILDDFTLDCKLVNFAFKVKSSAIKILTPKNNIILRYVYEYLNFLNLETTEHKRHYISEIEPMLIAYPDSNESVISFCDLMDKFDKKIENENKYLQSLLSQKNYLLSNMFI